MSHENGRHVSIFLHIYSLGSSITVCPLQGFWIPVKCNPELPVLDFNLGRFVVLRMRHRGALL